METLLTRNPGNPGAAPELSSLWEVQKAPSQLYVEGYSSALNLLKLLPSRGIALVGTRDPQTRAKEFTRKLIRDLSRVRINEPWIILSGFARGIDTTAHEAALESGLPTIAVVAGGTDRPYPEQNRELRQRIMDAGGLLISEHPPGTAPRPWDFLRRNRLIAGWSRATCVVQASGKSGALNTAHWASELDRSVFVVPAFPGEPGFEGNQKLLDREESIALWGASSLGQVWLECVSAEYPGTQISAPHHYFNSASPLEADAILLEQAWTEVSQGQAVATTQELLNWALRKNWSATRFFEALDRALDQRRLKEERGLLLKNP